MSKRLIVALVLLTAGIQVKSVVASVKSSDAYGSESSFIQGIEHAPLILSNDKIDSNSLQGSVYELLNKAQSSILILSFTFSDSKVIQIINQKATEGIKVQLIIHRDHISESKEQLHPSIKIDTRAQGEGHLHHKILVVDNKYIWLSSANFTPGSFRVSKNLAIGFFSPEIGARLHQEALDIALFKARINTNLISCVYGSQLLELYILPHNAPETPRSVETELNEMGKQKLITLIDNAKNTLYQNFSRCMDI